MNFRRNNSGIILLSVLGVMSVLSIMAMSMGQTTQMYQQMITTTLGRTVAKAGAYAGVYYGINLMEKEPSTVDSLFQAGIQVDSKDQADKLLKGVVLSKEEQFDITIEDETRRLNLNAINEANWQIFAGLLKKHGATPMDAEEIANRLVAWMIQEKKAPLDDVTELMLATPITREVFDKIEPDLTIYPQRPMEGLKVNFWTVSETLFDVLVEYVQENQLAQNMSDFLAVAKRYRVADHSVQPDAIDIAKLQPGQHVAVTSDYRITVRAMHTLTKTKILLKAWVNKDEQGQLRVIRYQRV